MIPAAVGALAPYAASYLTPQAVAAASTLASLGSIGYSKYRGAKLVKRVSPYLVKTAAKAVIRAARKRRAPPTRPKGAAKPLRARSHKRRKLRVKSRRGKLAKRVKEISKKVNTSLATHNSKWYEGGTVSWTANAQNVKWITGNQTTALDDVLPELKYYDPSSGLFTSPDPGTASGAQTKFRFKYVSAKLSVRNNGNFDAHVRIYCCWPKQTTQDQPNVIWSSNLSESSNATSTANWDVKPSDVNDLTKIWNLRVCGDYIIRPGQTVEVNNSVKDIMFQPNTVAEEWSTDYKAFGFLMVSSGTVCHGTSTGPPDETQMMLHNAGQLDWYLKRNFVVEYEAGTNANMHHYNYQFESVGSASRQGHVTDPTVEGYTT